MEASSISVDSSLLNLDPQGKDGPKMGLQSFTKQYYIYTDNNHLFISNKSNLEKLKLAWKYPQVI